MAIISRIGRKSTKVRLLYASMYVILILGAISMVYPFLLMISGSTKSAVDIKYFDAVPRFLREREWLYRKHIEAMFNEGSGEMNMVYDNDIIDFEKIKMPAGTDEKLLAEFESFLDQADLPVHSFRCGHARSPISLTFPLNVRLYKKMLKERFGADLGNVNRALGTEYLSWSEILLPIQSYVARRDVLRNSRMFSIVDEFKLTVPRGQTFYYSPQGYFKKSFLKVQYSIKIDQYNEEHGTDYASYADVKLSRDYPSAGNQKEKDDWETFMRSVIALYWIRADQSATGPYRAFLKSKYRTAAALNRVYGTEYGSFGEVPLIKVPPRSGVALTDWDAVIQGWREPDTGRLYEIPVESLHVHSTEVLFQDYLGEKYGSVAAVNAEFGKSYSALTDVQMPQKDLHFKYFEGHEKEIRNEFLTRNYKAVADYIILHGRGVMNTVIYCSLAIFLALLVNPMAAYAMSRYKIPSAYKILLFLLCTMAFPPMVTQIPNFMMLRKLGLLNTFAALVLPSMANGYAIFLLKGFFDAQPKELYESAQLDGASEWVLFWNITMSLSKPILAVIALQAFTAAYSNFMFAFVICQDERMWTLMVWLYQLQQRTGPAVMYASLIIAAIPTLFIFIFCQNIIMRGIVVPSEK